MQLCFFSGRVIRAFLIVASLSYASTAFSQTNGDNSSAEGGLADRCAPPGYQKKNPLRFGILNEQAKLSQRFMRWETTVDGRQQDAVSESQWNKMLVFKQNPSMQTPTCIKLINNYFFRAIQYLNKEIIYKKRMGKANPFNKNFEKMTQELYEYALKNDDTIIRVMLDKHSSYVRNDTKAKEAAKKKAAEEAAKRNDTKAKEAAKKKAAEEAAKKKADQEEAAKQAEMEKLMDAEMGRKDADQEEAAEEDAAQETKEDSSYILTNESLMEMFGDLTKQYPELANLKMEILIPANLTQMKTINSQGITRTMYCNPCTLGSPMLQSNSTGIEMGMPLVVYDGISEALIETFGGENPFKKSQIIKFGISSYKDIAKTINDPNIKKAMAMPTEQLKQIKILERQDQASRKKRSERSGGSAEGHDHDHDHEEEDWRTAPGSIYYD